MTQQKPPSRRVSLLLPIVPGVAVLAVWEYAVKSGWISAAILPPPLMILSRWSELLATRDYYLGIGATLWLMVAGLSFGILLGVGLGVLNAMVPSVRSAILPYVHALRALPAVALIPFMLTLFPGDIGRPLVIGAACAALIATSFDDGFRSITPERQDFAATAGLSSWRLVLNLYLPEVGRELLVGIRIAVGLALILAVVLEMLLGADRGLGVYISTHSENDRPAAYAAIASLALVGIGVNSFISWLSRQLLFWEKS